jgi:serine/threonine-protein kinase HipA
MARVAGIDVPDHRLIPTRTGSAGYFASKRFDRLPEGGRRHVVSAAGALDIDWTVPQIDYHALLQLVRRVTRSQAEVEEMFRRMLFNVAAHNRDDHAKQHSFFCDPGGAWHLTPAYDLTYSSGPGGEHYLAVSGEAGDIGPDAIAVLAKAHDINPRRLRANAGTVLEAVGRFTSIAGNHGVSKATAAEVQRRISSARKRLAALAR